MLDGQLVYGQASFVTLSRRGWLIVHS